MPVHLFFIFILVFLVAIFSYFTPKYPGKKADIEIPKIELFGFKLYEFSPQGLDMIFDAKKGQKFDNRYDIQTGILYDNTHPRLQSISADKIKYQDNIVHLWDHVVYNRDDGLAFYSDQGVYDTNKKFIKVDGKFLTKQKQNQVAGNDLTYDMKTEVIEGQNIVASYQLN